MKTEIVSIVSDTSEDDRKVIRRFVKEIQSPNCYVELGTYRGGSAIIARKANPNIEIYTIDCQDIHRIPLEEDITFVLGLSLNVVKLWHKPIGVLFIDANHDEAGVDFDAWEKHVVKGGVILFHDYAEHSPDVIKDCQRIAKRKDYEVLHVPIWQGGSTSIFQIRKL